MAVRGGDNDSEETIIKTRLKELSQAMKFAQVKNYSNLMIKDREVKQNLDKINTLNLKQYDYVFVPNGDEMHIDHRPILAQVKKILRFWGKTKIISYEVWSPIPNPNLYLDITDIVEQKRELISHYKSQIQHNDYANKAISLNHYRGLRVGLGYTEAFLSERTFAQKFIQKYGFSVVRSENRVFVKFLGIKIRIKKL